MAAPGTQKRKKKEASVLPWVILVVAALIGSVWYVSKQPSNTRKAAPVIEPINIILPPPPPVQPPPPPPPPKEEPPPEEEEEMIEQAPVEENEEPPDEPSPEPPSEDLGGGVAGGTGPAIGSGSGGGNRIGGTGRRGGGSKFGWYAAKVQSSIRDALGRNAATRSATFSSLTVKVWADDSGRITRAQLVGSSGNPAVDQAIKNQILTGLMLPQAPPPDLPMPINLRISARKPTT